MDRGRYYGLPRRPRPASGPLSAFDPIDSHLRYFCCDCGKSVLPSDHSGAHVVFPINETRLANNAVDAGIVPLVRALILVGFGTLYSCGGHMERVGSAKPTYPYVVFRGPLAKIETLRGILQRIAGRVLEIRPEGADSWRLCAIPEMERKMTVRDIQALFDKLVDGLSPAVEAAQRKAAD